MSKKSVVLCEGFDDSYILGYYLFKTDSWTRSEENRISELYTLTKKTSRNEGIDIYKKNNDLLAIWAIGGSNSFQKGFKSVKHINSNFPEQGISKIFILLDRDNREIEECLNDIILSLKSAGIERSILANNFCNIYKYTVEGDEYELEIIPIIVPFEKNGALETVLISAIEEGGVEEKRIVDCAESYVNKFIAEDKLTKYLTHERLVLKAKFSAVISITNPDRSTAIFNTLLMSHPWEQKEEVRKHFKLLNELL